MDEESTATALSSITRYMQSREKDILEGLSKGEVDTADSVVRAAQHEVSKLCVQILGNSTYRVAKGGLVSVMQGHLLPNGCLQYNVAPTEETGL